MKYFLIFGALLVLLSACSEGKSPFTDNGNPGQIQAIVFVDDNQNGIMDKGEAGTQAQVTAMSDVSCPPTTDIIWTDTDPGGVVFFTDLKPGKYCVLPSSNGLSMTTKMTQEVYVSSDQVTIVSFGLAK